MSRRRLRAPRRRPVGRFAVRLVVAILAVVVVAAGCSGDDDGGDERPSGAPEASPLPEMVEVTSEELGPFDADPEDFGGPGTALGAGLEVPEGALLEGTTFPDLVGGGFRALLLVVGDPVAVHDEMSAQARDLGMEGTGGCLASLDAVGCSAQFADPADGESLTFSVSRRVGALGVVSGLGMQYRPPGSDDVTATPGDNTPTTPIAAVALPDPVPVPDVADVGVALRPPDAPARTVELGSELVGLPGPCACDGPGWSFVVELTGVERDVIAGYGRQFSDLGVPPDMEDRHRSDVTLVGLRVGEGDAYGEVRATLPDSGTPYAIVTVRPG